MSTTIFSGRSFIPSDSDSTGFSNTILVREDREKKISLVALQGSVFLYNGTMGNEMNSNYMGFGFPALLEAYILSLCSMYIIVMRYTPSQGKNIISPAIE